MQRLQKKFIKKDLAKKLVILVGPRQAGKTWLAKEIASEITPSVYLNYDQIQDRVIIKSQSWLPTTKLLILDELHKMPDWKNYLKGLYDSKLSSLQVLVTGSARLDTYNYIGDSLAGRYFRHRLLPISLSEISQLKPHLDLSFEGYTSQIEKFIEQGGFPEPMLAENKIEAQRWRLQYVNSMLSSDIFTIDQIQNIRAIQLIFSLLQNRVGSPVSYQSLAEDVGISPTTVKRYIEILEALFLIFRVTPYSKNIARSLIKEPKIYFFDTGLVLGDSGAKLENLVAVALLKHCYAKVDYQAEEYALHYLRTKDGQEIDFAITLKDEIKQMIEVKVSDNSISKNIYYFQQKYKIPAVQLVQHLRHDTHQNEIEILKAENFLAKLFM
jgi:predicted AAA+ superfamily ATPase